MNDYLDTTSAMETVSVLFQQWYDNRSFEEYMVSISRLMQRLPATAITVPLYKASTPLQKTSVGVNDRYCTSDAIFSSIAPHVSGNRAETGGMNILRAPNEPELPVASHQLLTSKDEVQTRFEAFCQTLDSRARSTCEKKYVNSLRTSCNSLNQENDMMRMDERLVNDHAQALLRSYLASCEEYFENFNSRLAEVLGRRITLSDSMASKTGWSPCVLPTFWLSQLNLDHHNLLSESWRAVMIEYGLAVTAMHRAQRLVALCDKPIELNEGLVHAGHLNWSPHDYPETLLLKAESGIMIREIQVSIAEEMMRPPGAQNTVMHLNMGEGKSSTIVPMVAAARADKAK